jgi:predicted metal-dependent RNase
LVRCFVTHGEPTSSEALADAIRKQFGLDVYVPHLREVLTLESPLTPL